eukprot:428099_1
MKGTTYTISHMAFVQWNTIQDIKTRKAQYDRHCLAVIVEWHCGPAKDAMKLLIVNHVYFSGQRCDVTKDTYRCRHRCLGSKHFVFQSVKSISKSKEALCGKHPTSQACS